MQVNGNENFKTMALDVTGEWTQQDLEWFERGLCSSQSLYKQTSHVEPLLSGNVIMKIEQLIYLKYLKSLVI